MKTDIKSLSFEELVNFIKQLSMPSFKARQIFAWLHKGVKSFDEMTDLSKEHRALLAENAFINLLTVKRKLISKIDGTVKYLFELMDGETVEAVVMKYEHGNTICISTQIGCRMGCSFCASTIGGLVRNLTPAEMLDEVICAGIDSGLKISNIVLMGIGEPLDNLDNVLKFLYNVNDANGLNIGMRHISLSTCGLVDGIEKLMEANIPITLSVSLHAAEDETRSAIMPVNKKHNIFQLISACKRYAEKTKRRISFEYSIINGVNDSEHDARQLAKLLSGMLCHVNIIPVNRVEGKSFIPPERAKIDAFLKILEHKGIAVTVRRKLGSDIEASCGQLRRKNQND